jgi:hypothetical protein
MNERPAGDVAKTRVTIRESTSFPKICCICGEPTSRRTKLVCRGQIATGAMGTKSSSDSGLSILVILAAIFGGVVWCFGARERGNLNDSTLTFRIPHCKACAKANSLEPASTDLEHYQISLIVHRDFANSIGGF